MFKKIKILLPVLFLLVSGCIDQNVYALCSNEGGQCCIVTGPTDADEVAHFCTTSSSACRKKAKEEHSDVNNLKTRIQTTHGNKSGYRDCNPKKASLHNQPSIQDKMFALNRSYWQTPFPAEQPRFSVYLASTHNLNDPYQCSKHCTEENAFCEAIGVGESGQNKLQQAGSLLNNQRNQEIAKQKVMNIFDQDADECGRGPINISNGKLTNAGASACSASFVSGTETITVDFPKIVTASINYDDGVSLLIPPDSDIQIKTSGPSKLLNGRLSFLKFTNDTFIGRVGNICLALEK